MDKPNVATPARRQLSETARAAIAADQRRRWSNPIRGSEHALQAAILSHIRLRLVPGVFVFAVPNGGARDSVTGARLKAEGVRAGVPDLALVIDGKSHFLEVKTERGPSLAGSGRSARRDRGRRRDVGRRQGARRGARAVEGVGRDPLTPRSDRSPVPQIEALAPAAREDPIPP